jgi:hypothetical protein
MLQPQEAQKLEGPTAVWYKEKKNSGRSQPEYNTGLEEGLDLVKAYLNFGGGQRIILPPIN